MASLLADGLNLGLTRMAEACSIASLGQLAWTSEWHIRDETYALALQRLVNQQQREPFAAMFGDAEGSSSDGQFFRAGGQGHAAANLNAHYGDDPGAKFYTHISSRYAPFYIKAIPATASEALHVLDALLYHQTDIMTNRHHTDGGGVSDHVFALCSLFGFRFAPRIPDLKDRRLYSFDKPSAYPALEPMIAGRINVALIRAHWQEILRIAASIKTGVVSASLIMRQLASYPRQNGVAAALRELGRMERTIFTLDWIEDPELRRHTGQELNKGKSRNSLSRAVFLHRLGEIRDRTYENQRGEMGEEAVRNVFDLAQSGDGALEIPRVPENDRGDDEVQSGGAMRAVALRPMTAGGEVVEDYGHVGLSLRGHPVSFLRKDLRGKRVATCAEAMQARDGRWVRAAGLVLVRQMPRSTKGVMFITIEDETGIANLVIWPKLFERQRRIIRSAGMLAVNGRVQREGDVVHLVAQQLADLSELLASIGTRDLAFPPRHECGGEFHHGGPGLDPRDRPPNGLKTRDIHVQDLRVDALKADTIKVKARDFRQGRPLC